MRRLAVVVLVAGVAATAAVAGFLGGSPSAANAARLKAAARRLDASTSRIKVTMTYTGEVPGLAESSMKEWPVLEGVMDYGAHRGTLRYVVHDQLILEIVYDGPVTYWRNVGIGKFLHTTKEWLKDSEASSHGFVDPAQRALEDPVQALHLLQGASDDVRDLGTAMIDGVATEHLAGTFDLAKVVPPTQEDRVWLEAELEWRQESGQGTTWPYEVWLQSGVLRRLVVTDTIPGAVGASSMSTIDFYDFGIPVVISPPAEDEVFTDDEYFELMEQATKNQPECEDNSGDDAQPESTDADFTVDGCLIVIGVGEGGD